ncbi:ribonuclease HI [Glycocaulis profundi]|nr:ribonuclease HI [Glycocaulis profundi]
MNLDDPNLLIAHTDGACSGNPGPGGWGVVISGREKTVQGCGHEPATTNQRMELTAAIKALRKTQRTPRPLLIVTDSEYVQKGATEWLAGWKAKGWKNAHKKPVANRDLWEELDALLNDRAGPVGWQWVKGHSGDLGNEEADWLARQGAEGASGWRERREEVAA